MAGRFVVLEGGAGTGKSTLLDALAAQLERRGLSVETVPEFADAAIGDFLERELAECSGEAFRERALAHFAAALANVAYQAETVVEPALETHDVVLAERFVDSAAVYSLPRVADRTDVDLAPVVDSYADALPVAPDLTVLLTLSESARRDRLRAYRPELLDDGELPDRFADRQRLYRRRLGDRDDVLVYENDVTLETAVSDLVAAIC